MGVLCDRIIGNQNQESSAWSQVGARYLVAKYRGATQAKKPGKSTQPKHSMRQVLWFLSPSVSLSSHWHTPKRKPWISTFSRLMVIRFLTNRLLQ